MKHISSILAGLAAVAVIGTAVAQAPAPTANVSNPAIGAGQQSAQGTPMGETGVQAASPAPAATLGAAPASTDNTTVAAAPRAMRADRN